MPTNYIGVWDFATLIPPMTLSVGNTTASISGAGAVRGAVRSTPSHAIVGLTYFYFDPTVVAANSAIQVGICNGAFDLPGGDIPGADPAGNSIGFTIPGSLQANILIASVPLGVAAASAQNNSIVLAVSPTKVWLSTNGGATWNVGGGGGNPPTDTGGYSTSTLAAGPYYAVVVIESNTGALNSLVLGAPVLNTTTTIADLFFAPTPGFVDLTQQANRRKFIAINGGAQNLQPDGSGPFAVAPPVFLSRETSDANNFAINKGRGGAFAIIGPDLTNGNTNPPGTSVTTNTAATTVPFSAILGDYLTGHIYAFNPDTLTDNGQPRKWLRRWRALPGDTTSAITFSYLSLDLETGSQIPAGTFPQLVLRWSDDGGKTWSGNRIIPVGATGKTTFTVKANRLGSTKRFGGSTRIFELSSTDPFKVSIISAEVLTK